jgi:hypothetical protein
MPPHPWRWIGAVGTQACAAASAAAAAAAVQQRPQEQAAASGPASHAMHAPSLRTLRLWGKIFEKAGKLKGSFDAASLTAFLWAASAANVGHFKTLFDLAGSAQKLLGSFTPGARAGKGRAGQDRTGRDCSVFWRKKRQRAPASLLAAAWPRPQCNA